ncbi:uncharacterized protein [Nicotiana sylvestris]|uniref:uncharacterized protein n=1 Tax=Nicotiana sylvestris TaxID=4096 RepID=UPI00388C37C4
METNCIQYVWKCHRYQIHADMIKIPPNELNGTSSPRSFSAWGMNVIGPIEHAASNGHRFILVAIDYFTKWVKAASYRAMTKKVVADFVRDLCTSTEATPYMLVYGTEAIIPTEVEIPSLKIIQEVELDNVEWVKSRNEQLALIDRKRMNVVCHGQLYQNRMSRSFNKRVKLRQFT